MTRKRKDSVGREGCIRCSMRKGRESLSRGRLMRCSMSKGRDSVGREGLIRCSMRKGRDSLGRGRLIRCSMSKGRDSVGREGLNECRMRKVRDSMGSSYQFHTTAVQGSSYQFHTTAIQARRGGIQSVNHLRRHLRRCCMRRRWFTGLQSVNQRRRGGIQSVNHLRRIQLLYPLGREGLTWCSTLVPFHGNTHAVHNKKGERFTRWTMERLRLQNVVSFIGPFAKETCNFAECGLFYRSICKRDL